MNATHSARQEIAADLSGVTCAQDARHKIFEAICRAIYEAAKSDVPVDLVVIWRGREYRDTIDPLRALNGLDESMVMRLRETLWEAASGRYAPSIREAGAVAYAVQHAPHLILEAVDCEVSHHCHIAEPPYLIAALDGCPFPAEALDRPGIRHAARCRRGWRRAFGRAVGDVVFALSYWGRRVRASQRASG